MHYIEVKETMRGYSEGMFLSPSPFNPYIRRHHKFTRKKILYSFFIEAILNKLPSLFVFTYRYDAVREVILTWLLQC